MSSFFTAPQNTDVPVPPGQDAFDVAPPNFRLIGQMFAKGIQDAGGTQAAGSWLGSAIRGALDAVLTAVAYILAFLLAKLLCIVAFLMRLITSVDDGAAPGFDAVAQSSLEHVFGLPLPGAKPRKVAAGVNADNLGASLGKQIISALTSGLGDSAGQTIQPSSAAAEKFLAQLSRIGIEGWVDGMVGEAVSIGKFHSLLELVPIMSNVLGLGRLSRRVLAPPLKILVEDPYTWKLNLNLRPTMLAHDAAVREFLRGKLTRAQLDDMLGRQGYAPAAIDALINLDSKLLALGDVDYMHSRNYWGDQTALAILQANGYDEQTARQLLQLAIQRRIDVHDQTLLDAYATAFLNGEIDQATLHQAVTQSNMPDDEKAVYESVIVTKRQLAVKHLTLTEVEALVKAHIMELDDVTTWMTRENYPPEEQTLLELWLFGKITTADQAAAAKQAAADAKAAAAKAKQQAADLKAAQAAAAAQVKGVSLSDFQQLVKLGKRTFADYQAFLQALGLQPAAIADLVDLLHAQITQQQTLQQQHDALTAAAAIKHIPLSQTESAVLAGVLTIADLQKFMQGEKYADADIQVMTSYIQAKLDAQKQAAATQAAGNTAAAAKSISLPNLARAVRLGLTTIDAYSAALDQAGFDQTSRDLMVGLLQDQIAADQSAAQKTTEAAGKAAAKQISLSALQQAVIAGLRPMADYQAQLSALGYSAADQQTMVALLQLQVDHAADVKTAQQSATAALAAKGLSLASLERAVKLGVLSIDDYKAELAAAGFPDDTVTILATSLLAEVAQTSQASNFANQAAAALGSKGISLAQEQALVKNGLATLDAYQSWLIAKGYSVSDAGALRDLLDLQDQQAAAAAAAHQAAQAKAADKDISLAKEEQAVVDGIQTMDDYRALLADLGFDALDTATLVALLNEKIAKAAATAGPPSSPTS